MEAPLVTVIITCYNQAHCIARTLESIKLQTYTNWECIIVDDGSTDNSAKVIAQATEMDQRFLYHYQKNQGVTKARNIGFALAKGVYINFLDGDDTFMPKKLEKQLEVFLEHKDVYICICDHQHYHEKQDKYVYHKFESLMEQPLNQLLYGWHNGVAFPTHAVLYNKNLWSKEEKPFDEDYLGRAEDWVFNIQVALKKQRYYFLKEVLCTYHHSSNNYTTSVLENESSFLEAVVHIYQYLPIPDRVIFMRTHLKQTIERYAETKKAEFYRSSGNWRLGNYLSQPFFWLKKRLFF